MAKFALDPQKSRGRFFDEKRDDFRTVFQHDRDRIIHSTAFRRLANKTQVFVSHEGDLFRSRLTHTLEVAQVARTLARRFALNEDAAEAIALSHDLGHPPFGHTGEDALAAKMKNYGGFDHNAQALRIVTLREERYAAFEGLNLTWEIMEGITKHNGPVLEPLPWALDEINQNWDLELATHASLEAQIAAIADDIAYNHHDLQDGIRAGLINDEDVCEVPLMQGFYDEARKQWPNARAKIIRYDALSRFFGAMVNDVFDETSRNLQFEPRSVDDIRNHGAQIVRFSDRFYSELKTLRTFLFNRVYRHPSVMDMRDIASEMIDKAFDFAFENPQSLPADWLTGEDISDDTRRARLVCDYVSGMTDGFLSVDWQFAHGLDWPKRAKN